MATPTIDQLTKFGSYGSLISDLRWALPTLRSNRGLSLRQAAEQIGMSHSVLWGFEMGDNIGSDKIEKILAWLASDG